MTPTCTGTLQGCKAAAGGAPGASLSPAVSPSGAQSPGQPRGLHEPQRHTAGVPGEPGQVSLAAGQVGRCQLLPEGGALTLRLAHAVVTRWALCHLVCPCGQVCTGSLEPRPQLSGRLELCPSLPNLRGARRNLCLGNPGGEVRPGAKAGAGETVWPSLRRDSTYVHTWTNCNRR